MSLYKGQVSPLKTFPSTSIECAWFLPPTPMHQKIIWFCRWCSSHHNYFWNTAWDNFFWRYSPFQERSCHQDHVFKIISVIIAALMSDNLMKKKNLTRASFLSFFCLCIGLSIFRKIHQFLPSYNKKNFRVNWNDHGWKTHLRFVKTLHPDKRVLNVATFFNQLRAKVPWYVS